MLRVGLSKKLDPTLNTSNQDPTLIIMNHILMVSQGSKVGTLPPIWDLLRATSHTSQEP